MGERFTRCMTHGYSGLPALDFRSEGLNPSEFAPILPVTSFLEDSGGSVFERLNVKSEDAFSLNVLLICSVSVTRYVLKKKLYSIYQFLCCIRNHVPMNTVFLILTAPPKSLVSWRV